MRLWGRVTAALIGALATVSVAGMAQAQGPARVKVGVLTCRVSGGTGFIFGSTKRLDCLLEAGRVRERYYGTINKYGVDVGATTSGVLTWAVLATTTKIGPGVLSGNYGGVGGEATLGIGVGANALVGGSGRSIALQPLSVQAQQGINLALGVAALHLRINR